MLPTGKIKSKQPRVSNSGLSSFSVIVKAISAIHPAMTISTPFAGIPDFDVVLHCHYSFYP